MVWTPAIVAVLILNGVVAIALFASLPTVWGLRHSLRGTADFLQDLARSAGETFGPAPVALHASRQGLSNIRFRLQSIQKQLGWGQVSLGLGRQLLKRWWP